MTAGERAGLAEMRRHAADFERHLAAGTASRRVIVRADELPPGPTAREAASIDRAAKLFHEETARLNAATDMPDLSGLTPFDKAELRAEVRRGLFPTPEHGQTADVVDLAETRRGRLPALASE